MKNHQKVTNNPPTRNYVNKLENRIIFKIEKGDYHERLTPETMNLLGSNKSKIAKKENGENVPHLQIDKVVWNG